MNRAGFWLHAGNHIEPGGGAGTVRVSARDLDLPSKPVHKSAPFGLDLGWHFLPFLGDAVPTGGPNAGYGLRARDPQDLQGVAARHPQPPDALLHRHLARHTSHNARLVLARASFRS